MGWLPGDLLVKLGAHLGSPLRNVRSVKGEGRKSRRGDGEEAEAEANHNSGNEIE
jgi:hypothetical protein